MLVRDAISPISESKTDETRDKLSRGDEQEGGKARPKIRLIWMRLLLIGRTKMERGAQYTGLFNDDNSCNSNNAARMEMKIATKIHVNICLNLLRYSF